MSSALTVGGDVVFVDRQYYVGDDANQNAQLPSYTVASIRATYAISRDVDVFGAINNLLDRKYAVYGTFFQLDDVANALPQPLTDPRTLTPAQASRFAQAYGLDSDSRFRDSRGGRAPGNQGISYTAISSAMPRTGIHRAVGLMPSASSSSIACGWSTIGPVASIERETARHCTREAMLTV